jgi:hypothetical protein
MNALAKEKEGECLSKKYINSKTNLLWKCSKGHVWKARPCNIKTGTWCPICSRKTPRRKPLTIEQMQKIAKSHGGKCLSNEYINARTKLLWECTKGHRWMQVSDKIKQGTWCLKCSSRKSTINEMQKIAKVRGGECLSDVYVNAQSKLLWECAHGHRWEAAPNNITRGRWCPVCAATTRGKRQRLTIEMMESLARERNGKCLSDIYINNRTKLLWECYLGHKWWATPGKVRLGQWCSKCSKQSAKNKVVKL